MREIYGVVIGNLIIRVVVTGVPKDVNMLVMTTLINITSAGAITQRTTPFYS